MCITTDHTVPDNNGLAISVQVTHNNYSVIQYDFYIPQIIWDLQDIQNFIQQLQSIESSATIFMGLVGVWQGSPESLRIYRMILRTGQFNPDNVRNTIQNSIGDLMAKLSVTQHTQEEVMFTEMNLQVSKSILI